LTFALAAFSNNKNGSGAGRVESLHETAAVVRRVFEIIFHKESSLKIMKNIFGFLKQFRLEFLVKLLNINEIPNISKRKGKLHNIIVKKLCNIST